MNRKLVPTQMWHQFNADGTKRLDHCCGCFDYILEDGGVPYAQCNECGEKREAIFKGVS